VHAEWNDKSVHAYTFAQLLVRAMRNFAHSASFIAIDVQGLERPLCSEIALNR